MRYLGLVGVAIVAYLAGAGAYLAVLALIWGQSVGRELKAVLFWGGLAYVVAALPLYLIVFTGLALVRKLFLQSRTPVPRWLFPLLGMALGLVPTCLILRLWGGGLSHLFTPEAALFYSFFGASGLCFGAGWWWLFGRRIGAG